MIKQALGNKYWAIGGHPSEIIPLFISLLNWKGINCHKHLRHNPVAFEATAVNDLGDPETFCYFEIRDFKFVEARTKAFVNCNSFPKGTRDAWATSAEKANQEFNGIKEENFLGYKVLDVPTYNVAATI